MSSTLPPVRLRAEPVPPEVAQRAVEWLVDLQAQPVSPTLQSNWRRWRAAHPDHERAWQRIETVHSQLFGPLHHLPSPVKSAISQASLTPPRSQARRNAISTLTLLLFAGGTSWMTREETGWSEWVADLRTAPGERRTVMLADGSTLVLNTASAVNVDFSASERRVRLIAGEVLISTAQDVMQRPFLVETSQGEARALGTRYTVRSQNKRTDVAVFKGAVRITPRHASWQADTLQAGLRTSFTLEAITSPQAADQGSAAWTDGVIIAKGMRLADLVAELSRYSPVALSCDPTVADLRVSGSYPLSDIHKVLETLSAMLSLQLETITRFWGLQTVRISLMPRRVARS